MPIPLPLPLRRFATLFACLLLASGCASRRPVIPMVTQTDRSACTQTTDTLLVLLPGAYSSPEEFEREGFVTAVRERNLAVDVQRVDAHLGYYDNGSIVARLHDDVIAPARAQGYRAIWIVGISVGGFGGMVYAENRPGELAGLVALAPYLGERLTSTEIDNAGGLARWYAPWGPLDMTQREPRELRLWRWLQGYSGQAPGVDRPPLWLGFGESDRFAFSHRLLAAVLPPDHVATTPGGHDWPEWRRLWQSLLPRLPLPACK
ncbi:MAG: alpha/beta hydrolase [Variovorax sp.]|nr:MAG: alpha/beta hydrolase [Variovorax sp.]